MTRADLFDTILENPDIVGQSEYRALYELLDDATDGADELDDVAPLVLACLDNLDEWVTEIRSRVNGVNAS